MENTMYEGLATIRSSLEDTLARILALKRKEGEGNLQLRELVTEASVMFVDLRRVNREILQEEDRRKLETEAAKAPVDHTTLQLHNLLYEKNYYLKVIKGCKDFKSKYPDIDLVSEQEFFRDAPEEHRSDPALHHDPHKLMLQRLNFELHQRKELLKQREVVEARKKILQENITNQRKFLGSLLSHLKVLKKASLPVQQQLGLLHTKRMKQHALAELLPPALYIVYTQLLSHKEAFEEALELEIVGSAKDALTLAQQAAMKDAGVTGVTGAGTDDVKPEEEVPEDDDDSRRRRKRVKRTHEKEIVEEDNIYQPHPLAVIVQIFDNEQKTSKLLALRFEFLTKINVLCAGIEGASYGGGDPDTLLANLFPDDTGVDLPNQISKLQAGPGFTFDKKRHSWPYKWVQHLGGIDILPESPPHFQEKDGGGMNGYSSTAGNSNSLVTGLATYRLQHRVSNILHQLRVRTKAQLALKEQLDSLTKLKRPFPNSHAFPWIEYTPKATFQTWAEIDHTGLKLSSSFASLALPSSHSTVRVQSTLLFEAQPVVEEGLVGIGTLLDCEAGKEDGELPSSGMVVSPFADAVKAATDTLVLNEVKVGVWAHDSKATMASGREASKSNVNIIEGSSSKVTSLGLVATDLGKVSGHVDVDDRKDVYKVVSGDSQKEGIFAELGGLDALLDEDMGEAMEAVQLAVEDLKDKADGHWKEYGMRTFRAVFWRENGPSREHVELEAQVDISLDYPVCPPLFQVHILSDAACVLTLPAAPGGVMDVTEASVSKTVSCIDHSNNLRAIEAEVNIAIPQHLPIEDQNQTLAHQIAALMMLFDIYIDSELGLRQSSHGGGTADDGLRSGLSDLLRVKSGNVRPCRGRDRRKPLPWVLDNIGTEPTIEE